MGFDIIQQLRSALPSARPALLESMYRKNISFFSSRYPEIICFLEHEKCPYRIDITDTFVAVIDERTDLPAHPEVGLDHFAELLGSQNHETWIDLFNFEMPMLKSYPKHHAIVQDFRDELHRAFPALTDRLAGGRINLKQIDTERVFSPPVVFLGIFHGLHIAHYLQNTCLTTALFIEPQPERFEVSCYFLDYTELDRQFGTLYLAIGEKTTSPAIESFFSLLRITPLLWSRVLCGYAFENAHFFIEAIKSLQVTNTNMLFPLDNEYTSFMHGAINLSSEIPLLTKKANVSRQCKIAIVATGPSLDNDLQWLKNNHDKIIVFSVHSAVKVLRDNGIIPDFQFNLDAVINYDFKKTHHLFPEIPLITDYKAPPHILNDFAQPLLCADTHKNSLVHFLTSLAYTHPSTTNLAFAFACFLQPQVIYLLGCDFGYRSLSRDHATGSFYEECRRYGQSVSYAEEALQSLVEPNFAGTDPVQTISQHLRTRIVMEKCIAAHAPLLKIYNFSDGAKISGAIPQKSSEIFLTKYTNKKKDIKKVLGAFSPAREHINWCTYAETGVARLQRLKTKLLAVLTIENFCWQDFSKAIDSALYVALYSNREDENDQRMDIYYRVLNDVLCQWYRCLILFDDLDQAEKIFRSGLYLLQQALEKLEWPDIFDQIQHEEIEHIYPPDWKIYRAQVYAQNNKLTHAKSLITAAYRDDPAIQDGFAKLAAIEIAKGNSKEGFALMAQDECFERLSPTGKLHLAQLYGRDNKIEHAKQLIKSAYAEDAMLKDGFAHLATLKKANKDWDAALDLAMSDLRLARLSPDEKINIAELLGRTGNFILARQIILEAYQESTIVKDGFARLGWIKMEHREWQDAYDLYFEDHIKNRLTPLWKSNSSLIMACLHRWQDAIDLVTEAYAEDTTLCDGYSRIGLVGYLAGLGIDFYSNQILKDKNRKNFYISNLLHQAICLAIQEKHSDSFHLVTQAYRKNAALLSWRSSVGWIYIKLGQFERALNMMECDLKKNRMSPFWLPSYAVTLGVCNKQEKALLTLDTALFDRDESYKYIIGYSYYPESMLTKAELRDFIASGKKIEALVSTPLTSGGVQILGCYH